MSEQEPLNTSAPERYTLKKIGNDVAKVFNLERGIFYTLWVLVIRPGKTIRGWLFERRERLVKPFPLLLLSTTLATLVSFMMVGENFQQDFQLGLKSSTSSDVKMDTVSQATMLTVDSLGVAPEIKTADSKKKKNKNEELVAASTKAMEAYQKFFNIILLLSVPVFAFSNFLFFRKSGFFFAEQLVVSSYTTSIVNFTFFICAPAYIWGNQGIYAIGATLLGMSYFVFALYNIFEGHWYNKLLRILGSILVYTILFIFVIMLIIAGLIAYYLRFS